MNVDWAIAVSVFLVFIGLGFALYWGLFETNQNPVQPSLENVNQKVLDFLEVDSWRVPVTYNSSQPELAVLYLDFPWPEGARNSARILDSGLELSCVLQGDRLYFEANVDEGENNFDLTFANVSSPLMCDSTLETAGANLSIPWASEKSVRISQSRISQMLATDYSRFRESLGISRNFRVQAGTSLYGPSPPAYTNTYARETRSMIQETGQPVTITIMVW